MREHTGTSIAVALVATMGFAIWASVIVAVMWLSLTIYAIVKWIGQASDQASPRTVLLVMVADITLFLLLWTLAIFFIGKPMRTRKGRRSSEAEQPSLPVAEG
jgi:sorbitol-specific phosphotransferase system component IIC